MSSKTKIWLTVGALSVLLGCIIFGGAMSVIKWDFTKLSTNKYETNNYEINEDFSAVSVNTDTADVSVLPSENSKCSVECYERKNAKHTVTVKDGVLAINIVDARKWYEYIGINFGTPKITVYLPAGEYGALSVKSDTGDVKIPKDFSFEGIDVSASTGNITNYASASQAVKIKTTTGRIKLENVSATSIDLSVSTGDVAALGLTCEGDVKIGVSTGKTELIDAACKNLISDGNTGDISLKNVIASEKLSIKRSTGDVRFDACDAAEIFVITDTGDVRGSLLSEKVFIVNTDTGRKEVPDTITGGRCEITTDTGDVKITID